jgi:thioredoxin 2
MPESHVHTRCSGCQSVNRIPIARVGLTGRCGRCREELPRDSFFAEWPVEITDGKFDAVTRMSPNPVLVDFWAEWCAPCRQLAPVLEQLASTYGGRLLVAKLDTERNQATPTRFGVQSIPTLVLLRSGIEVDRIIGVQPLTALQGRIDRFMS